MRHLIDLFWNLVIVALTVVACYLCYMRGYFDRYLSRRPEPIVLAAPSAPTVKSDASRAGSVSAQPVSPEAAPTATPEATPTPEAPIDLATIDPHNLPLQVKLCRPTAFPIMVNGQRVGSTTSPAGMMFRLVGVQGDRVEVRVGEGTQLIPADATDVISRVRALRQYVGNARPTPTALPPWATPAGAR